MSWLNDGGHGGRDPGASHNGVIEKVYTLEASLYVNSRLIEHGIVSECTRYMDVTLEQHERTSKVKKFKKCMSHHLNGGGGNGVEVIRSIYSDGEFEKLIIEEFKAAGYPVRPTPIFTKTLKDNNKVDYYFMHRETGNCRTTIIEYDFVDGPQNEKLKDKAYREGMYECVVRAICRDEGVIYKPLKGAVSVEKNENQEISSWAKTSVEKARNKKDKNGTPIMHVANPKGNITEEQLAVILDRVGLLDK